MNTELLILTELDLARPRLLKRSVLLGDVRMAGDELTELTFDRAIESLERKKQIRIHAGEDVTKYAITNEGSNRRADAK